MKRLNIKWTPDLRQDLDAITTKGFIMYDEEVTNLIISKYGSVENYKNSDDFKKLIKITE